MRKLLKIIKVLRSAIFSLIAKRTCGHYESIKANGYTRLTQNTSCGKNVNFNGCIIYGAGKVMIGDNFHSGNGMKIITQIHNYHGDAIPYDNTYITKDVIIEDNVWLGMDVTILSGVTIGEGAIIQAGSVVVSDIPKLAIAGGHPAKIFSKREEKHYFMCKKSKVYH